MEKLILVILTCWLSACNVTTNQINEDARSIDNLIEAPTIQRASDKVINYPELDGPKITVAVYDFKDMTCLLYTSPSPRDRQKSRMPSSA